MSDARNSGPSANCFPLCHRLGDMEPSKVRSACQPWPGIGKYRHPPLSVRLSAIFAVARESGGTAQSAQNRDNTLGAVSRNATRKMPGDGSRLWSDITGIPAQISMIFLRRPRPSCTWKPALNTPVGTFAPLRRQPIQHDGKPDRNSNKPSPRRIPLTCRHACCHFRFQAGSQ